MHVPVRTDKLREWAGHYIYYRARELREHAARNRPRAPERTGTPHAQYIVREVAGHYSA